MASNQTEDKTEGYDEDYNEDRPQKQSSRKRRQSMEKPYFLNKSIYEFLSLFDQNRETLVRMTEELKENPDGVKTKTQTGTEEETSAVSVFSHIYTVFEWAASWLFSSRPEPSPGQSPRPELVSVLEPLQEKLQTLERNIEEVTDPEQRSSLDHLKALLHTLTSRIRDIIHLRQHHLHCPLEDRFHTFLPFSHSSCPVFALPVVETFEEILEKLDELRPQLQKVQEGKKQSQGHQYNGEASDVTVRRQSKEYPPSFSEFLLLFGQTRQELVEITEKNDPSQTEEFRRILQPVTEKVEEVERDAEELMKPESDVKKRADLLELMMRIQSVKYEYKLLSVLGSEQNRDILKALDKLSDCLQGFVK